jgi:hypothetical protein
MEITAKPACRKLDSSNREWRKRLRLDPSPKPPPIDWEDVVALHGLPEWMLVGRYEPTDTTCHAAAGPSSGPYRKQAARPAR